jgi:hypothetical protein
MKAAVDSDGLGGPPGECRRCGRTAGGRTEGHFGADSPGPGWPVAGWVVFFGRLKAGG